MCHSYWTRSFKGLPEQVADVRELIRWVIGDVDGADDVVLVASELAANAIRHSASGDLGGSLALQVAAFSDAWHVRLTDQGGRTNPTWEPADDDEAGRGLPVVMALSRAWGVIGGSTGRTVWAEIPYPKDDVAAEFYEGDVERGQQEPALSVVDHSQLGCRPTTPLVPRWSAPLFPAPWQHGAAQ
ncbi:ATP-binding protein [Catenulispora acidiphila]